MAARLLGGAALPGAVHPLLGVGFGRPAAFTWNGVKYDYRDDDPNTSFNVAGPHNSFVSWIYRLGVIGALALLWVMFVAVRNAQPGVPPVGTYSDYGAFFGAEVILALGLLTILFTWLLRPAAK